VVVGNVRVAVAGEWDRSVESLMSGGVRSGRQSSDGVAAPTRNGRTGVIHAPIPNGGPPPCVPTVYLQLPSTFEITFPQSGV